MCYETASNCRLFIVVCEAAHSDWQDCCDISPSMSDLYWCSEAWASLSTSMSIWWDCSCKSSSRSECSLFKVSWGSVNNCRSKCLGDRSLARMNVFRIRTACRRHCSASGIFFNFFKLCLSIFVLFSLNLLSTTRQGSSIGSRSSSFLFILLRLLRVILPVSWCRRNRRLVTALVYYLKSELD